MDQETIRIFIIWSLLLLYFISSTPIPQKQVNTSRTVSFFEQIFSGGQLTPEIEKLEADFQEHFGDLTVFGEGGTKYNRSTYWLALMRLDQYDTDVVRHICQEAYNATYPHLEKLPNLTETWSYDTFVSELSLRAMKKRASVHVLECWKQNFDSFYLIKGRRPTSVYFVKPTAEHRGVQSLEDVILDENFERDINLKTDFNEKMFDVLRARGKRLAELTVHGNPVKRELKQDL